MNKQLTLHDYLKIRKYIIKAISALPIDNRIEGFEVMDILANLLSNDDLQKVVEILYNEHINQSTEV